MLIFTDAQRQLWLWPERRASGGTRLVSHDYQAGQPNAALEQRLERIRFSLSEEDGLTPLAVRERVRTAFNAEKITNKFYKEVSGQKAELSQAISGLEGEDRQLYASILLDRLMFIYFIQQKGFLDNDREYLSHRLQKVRELQGPDRFYEFYRDFLVPLFHQGLGSSAPVYTDPVIRTLIGDVPYINGGIFSEIPMERDARISVPDAAFEKVFALFDQYRWHLDERHMGTGREINPEVLGYILEQYINQKEQGAYYTADDITGYMAGFAVTGYFLDQMADPSLWALLRADPDRYMPEAMRYGESEAGFPENLMPADWVEPEWEEPAAAAEGLPTEKRREAADRIRTCRQVRDRIQQGTIACVNAATTANLDITQLAIDWLSTQISPKILWKAWQTLTSLRVLDPTCGSGAFLLAAMKVLQDLYEATFEAIQEHVDTSHGNPDIVLSAISNNAQRHSSRQYYLRKTIALHNLYGVDIMPEAVEIARLRLFLALAATVDERDNLEPLPDLDMNIRCGNILVGCVHTDDLQQLHAGDMTVMEKIFAIETEAVDLRGIYQKFQEAQGRKNGDATDAKNRLHHKTENLRYQLDRLFSKADDQKAHWDFQQWQTSHQPFHWIAEFPEAILDGGFSVVIGNPPFIRKNKVVPGLYQFEGFETDNAPDIYAPCMERAVNLLERQGRFAMIAPIALVAGLKFKTTRHMMMRALSSCWITVFDLRPDKLFDAQVRPAITIGCLEEGDNQLYTSNLRRWRPEYRPYLFATTRFSSSKPVEEMHDVWPLIGDEQAYDMLQVLQSSNRQLGEFICTYGRYQVGRKAIMNLRFMIAFLSEPPCWQRDSAGLCRRIPQTTVRWMRFDKELHQQAAFLLFAGRLGHLLWTFVSDAFNITNNMIKWFPCDLDRLASVSDQITDLAERLNEAQMNAPTVDRNKGFIGGYDISACRHITDEADQLIMEQLGVGCYWPSVLLLDNRIVKSTSGGSTTVYRWMRDWTPTRGPWDPSLPE